MVEQKLIEVGFGWFEIQAMPSEDVILHYVYAIQVEEIKHGNKEEDTSEIEEWYKQQTQ